MSEPNNITLDTSDLPLQVNVPSSSRYNNWAFQPILHQHFNRLRARLLNLAETSTRDKQQSEAMKGLIKDFLNEAYFAAMGEIESFCRDKQVIPNSEPREPLSPPYNLSAKSLNDILYEPE